MLQPSLKLDLDGELDELFKNAVEIVVQYDRASPSLLQRRLSIGYARAARLMDQLEVAGVVSPAEGSKPRDVLISNPAELLGSEFDKSQNERENVFGVPANYKIPENVKLTRVENPEWVHQLTEVVSSNNFKNLDVKYPILQGFDDEGKLIAESLSDVNNLIIVGNPISKKENWLDTVLVTLLLKHSPEEIRYILIDPRHYLDFYDGIPHLLAPVITDFDKVVSAYRWAVEEMDRRMRLFAQAGVRNIDSYNQVAGFKAIPLILIVSFYPLPFIETTDALTLLTSNGGKAGIHNLIVVDRANQQSLSENIKANIPARAVFTVTSAQESKFAGVKGAENLKEGEMLFKQGNAEPVNFSTIFTPEINVKEIVEKVKQ